MTDSMSRLRILHVILSTGFSGSERSAAEYCNFLHSQEHDVAVVLCWWQSVRSRARFASTENYLDPAIRIMHIPRQAFPLAAFRAAVASFAPDIIHSHLTRATGLTARLQSSALTVASLHMHNFHPAYLGVNGLLCVARWQERLIPHEYTGQILHVPNVVRPHRRLQPDELKALRWELGISESEYVIGGVGRLIERKGWEVLIRAFRAADLPGARLLIIGEGPRGAALRTLGGTRLLMPGFRDNVKDYFQVMDLFVSSARHEAFGLVLVEALDGGVPVIASETEGCGEILRGYPGDLYPIDDAEALQRLLVKHHRERTARRRVDLDRFLPGNAGGALVRAYVSLLEGRADRKGRPEPGVPQIQRGSFTSDG